jgi:hypothetical protein
VIRRGWLRILEVFKMGVQRYQRGQNHAGQPVKYMLDEVVLTAGSRKNVSGAWTTSEVTASPQKHLVTISRFLVQNPMATLRGYRYAFSWPSKYLPPKSLFNCSSCTYIQRLPRRRERQYATHCANSKKPFYITTPIFYVNAG